jgi:hypothetical protein
MHCGPSCQHGRALIYHFVFSLPIRYKTTISNWYDPQKNFRHFWLPVPAESIKSIHDAWTVLSRRHGISENALSTAKMVHSATTGIFRVFPSIFPRLPLTPIFAMNCGSSRFRYDQRHDGIPLAGMK